MLPAFWEPESVKNFHSWDANITYQKHTRSHGRNSGLSAQLKISHCSAEIRGWGLQNVLQGHTWQSISVSSSRDKAPRLSFDCLQRWHHPLKAQIREAAWSSGLNTKWRGKKTLIRIQCLAYVHCVTMCKVLQSKRERGFSLQRITKQNRKRGVLLQRVTKRERAKERERGGVLTQR